jgi:hypothetical protein
MYIGIYLYIKTVSISMEIFSVERSMGYIWRIKFYVNVYTIMLYLLHKWFVFHSPTIMGIIYKYSKIKLNNEKSQLYFQLLLIRK